MHPSELRALYRKVGGGEIIRKIICERMISAALLSMFANGTSRKGLEITRLTLELKTFLRIKRKYVYSLEDSKRRVDEAYRSGWRATSKDVWVLWLQGQDRAPEVVRKCINSHEKHLKDRNIHILTEGNYRDYVSFPLWIQEKIDAGIITRTHMSDLLRLELLNKYGGTWIDATVFLSDKPSEYMLESPLFLFQTLKPGLDGHATAISSWFMTSQSDSRILMLARELLYEYWKNNDRLIDYFLIHYFIQIAIEQYPEEWGRVVPASNEPPHMLLLSEGRKDARWIKSVRAQTPVHKLTYKCGEERLAELNEMIDWISRV